MHKKNYSLKTALMAIAVMIGLSFFPPEKSDAIERSSTSFDRSQTPINVYASFSQANYVTVQHDKFQVTEQDIQNDPERAFLKRTKFAFHGSLGEVVFVSSQVLSQQEFNNGIPAKTVFLQRPHALNAGQSWTHNISLTKLMQKKKNQRKAARKKQRDRYVALQVSYI